MKRSMNVAKSSSLGVLVAAVINVGCVVIEGPITYSNTGGSSGTGSSSGGSGGSAGSTTSSTTTASSSTSSSSSGTGGGACATPVSDEFTGPSLNVCWKQLNSDLLAAPPSIVGGTELLMLPASQSENGWFRDSHGPFLYQDVTGDFVFVVRGTASVTGGGAGAPTKTYNTAGVLVRDPSSHPEHENWALIDIGRQGGQAEDGVDVGSMMKVTKPSMSAGMPSETVKFPKASGTNRATFAICRRGAQISLHYAMDDEAQPLDFAPDMPEFTWGNISSALQVGLIVGTWVIQPDLLAHFEYARFGIPKAQESCETAVERVFQNLP